MTGDPVCKTEEEVYEEVEGEIEVEIEVEPCPITAAHANRWLELEANRHCESCTSGDYTRLAFHYVKGLVHVLREARAA